MAAPSTVRLLAIEPDIGRYLTSEEGDGAETLSVPARDLAPGPLDVHGLLTGSGAFGAFIVTGVLLHHLQIGEQPALRLLGPGDILSLSEAPPSLLTASRCVTVVSTRLAILGTEFLVAARRWPRLIAGLHVRTAEQGDRLATQLAICQLPRVDQRLLSLMWMLAESWGYVTPHGTRLPMSLTHDTLGGLIGARRPTVTLALRELAERGAVVRQGDGWLLLEDPRDPEPVHEPLTGPSLIASEPSRWSVPAEPARRQVETAAYEELKATVRRLSEQHRHDAQRMGERLRVTRELRAQAARSRERIASRRLNRRQAPSS